MSTPPANAAAPPAGKPAEAKPAESKTKGGGIAKLLATGLTFVAGAAAGGFGGAIGVSQFGGGGHAEAPAKVAPEPVEYVEIDNAFTSNLIDTGRYLQLRLSVSTTGGEAVVAAVARHKPALVGAVLSVLGELAEADVADRPAKDRLRDRLQKAINDALKAKGEAGAIEEVFFTSLVVQ